jgi:hypothetical protein
MRVDRDHLIFSSGKRVHANCAIVGLTADGALQAFDGYDGGIEDDIPQTHPNGLTLAERRELAAHMIQRWLLYAWAER